MHRALSLVAASCLLLAMTSSAADLRQSAPVRGSQSDPSVARPRLLGFAPESVDVERQWEARFRAIPDTKNLHDWMKRLSARPHHIGSPYGKDNAYWMLSKFKEWGLDARIETYDVLFPMPIERAVELVAPTRFAARLAERAFACDPTSGQTAEQIPTYLAFSADGDVTAPLVYVNRGVPEDYEMLKRMGVSVKGAIVIARFGGVWRGVKPKIAAEHGAVGCLIYSDPQDDGYYHGEPFPNGPWRPADSVQRGGVGDMLVHPGDPLTPDIAATPKAKRLRIEEARTLTKIPVFPLSSADAQPLLAALGGRVAPSEWRGVLPITYHIGPGPARVHLKIKCNWDLVRVYDVIATIPGASDPDQWIIRGNHHDAWVNGASDPLSGAVALLEEARAMALMVKQGWRPKRTIMYCLWDGEEAGLMGSTEWVEDHLDELRRKAVVYLNTDTCGRGYFTASGSHTLEKFVNSVARDVTDPQKGISVWKRQQLAALASPAAREEARRRADLRIGAMQAGSDFVPFLDHVGIASLDFSYGGEGGGGRYHSIYDDFYAFTRFDDPGFVYCHLLSQTTGTAVMRLAGADLLPFDFGNFTDTVRRYVDELHKVAKDNRESAVELNRQLDDGVFAATMDSRNPLAPPSRRPVPPSLNFEPLEKGLAAAALAAEHYDRAVQRFYAGRSSPPSQDALREVNAALVQTERAITLPEGLPNRPWHKHQIYAPALSYGGPSKSIVGVREAIDGGRWTEAAEQMGRVGRALENMSREIDRAAAALERATM